VCERGSARWRERKIKITRDGLQKKMTERENGLVAERYRASEKDNMCV
jgi:hypothetical protein